MSDTVKEAITHRRTVTHPRRRKYQQAMTDGRLLRNGKGHIVKDPTHDPGVVLCRPTLAVPVTTPIDRSTANGGMP